MTPAQRQLYWRLWAQIVRQNGWRDVARVLSPSAVLDASDHHRRVHEAAIALAQQEGRAMAADHLRHGAHVIALGRSISSDDLKRPADIDRVFNLFKLLANPENIAAAIKWENPDMADRERLVWRIRSAAPQAYIDAICADRFGSAYTSPFYEDLPIACLRDLVKTLSERTDHFRQPIVAAEPAAP